VDLHRVHVDPDSNFHFDANPVTDPYPDPGFKTMPILPQVLHMLENL
jgi:hypothetical protein